jgi:DNA-binding NarL/FixJ family response regulator
VESIKIFVVDDHPIVRRGIESIFDCEADITVAGSAGSAAEALQQIDGLEVDIVLSDLRMGEMNGDEFLQVLRERRPEIRTAVLTNFHSDEEVFKALRAGVRAFLLKTSPMNEVIAAVRAVHAGERWIPPHIAQQLADQVSRDQLTGRELSILRLLADGMKNEEIAAALHLEEDVLSAHVNHLLEKLDSRAPAEAVNRAFHQGLLRVDD